MAASRPAASRSSSFSTLPTQVRLQRCPVTAPSGFLIDAAMVIDALEGIVGYGALLYLQHSVGSRFGAAASFMAVASKLVVKGDLQLNSHTVALQQVGLM